MKGSDNPFPSVLLDEGSEPTAPSAGNQRLYIDGSDHVLKSTDSSGNVSPHAPILLLGSGVSTPPAGTAAGTILIQKA